MRSSGRAPPPIRAAGGPPRPRHDALCHQATDQIRRRYSGRPGQFLEQNRRLDGDDLALRRWLGLRLRLRLGLGLRLRLAFLRHNLGVRFRLRSIDLCLCRRFRLRGLRCSLVARPREMITQPLSVLVGDRVGV